jgi:hypothetical protein
MCVCVCMYVETHSTGGGCPVLRSPTSVVAVLIGPLLLTHPSLPTYDEDIVRKTRRAPPGYECKLREIPGSRFDRGENTHHKKKVEGEITCLDAFVTERDDASRPPGATRTCGRGDHLFRCLLNLKRRRVKASGCDKGMSRHKRLG